MVTTVALMPIHLGNLVRWRNGRAGNTGVVASVLAGGRQARVHVDSDEDRTFAWPTATWCSLISTRVERGLRGGLIVIGEVNLGGGMATIANAVAIAELVIGKGAATLLAPIPSLRQFNDLFVDMANRVSIMYYGHAREALVKALGD